MPISESPGFASAVVLLGAPLRRAGIGLTGARDAGGGACSSVNAIYLPMVFLSGSFFSPRRLPGFLRAMAEVLSLTYFIAWSGT